MYNIIIKKQAKKRLQGCLQMSLQIIKSQEGHNEYVLLPFDAYVALKKQIDQVVSGDYETFDVNDYVTNPAALMRIKANLTQSELAERLDVSQAYISKLESQDEVTAKMLSKIKKACK